MPPETRPLPKRWKATTSARAMPRKPWISLMCPEVCPYLGLLGSQSARVAGGVGKSEMAVT